MSIVSDTVAFFRDGANWSGDDGIPNRLVEHVGYTALTVAIAAVVAVPLGLYIGHTGRLRTVSIAVTGALRAIPTLGVLTWLVLLVGLGLWAPILSLVLLAIPPLLAGVYSGLENVNRQTIDAARAIGMTEWQILTKVELPLALPLVVGGFRSATLQVVATATVAAYVSLGGLGRYIIDGQRQDIYEKMLAGSVLVILLALVLDGAFAGLQALAARTRSTPRPVRA